MNADEIVKALRKACECCGCCGEYEVIGHEAAELIERLQAKLAESQRREKAAVEDMKRICSTDCDICMACKFDDGSGDTKFYDPKLISKKCSVCVMSDNECFEWRGPQAGEGGQDG